MEYKMPDPPAVDRTVSFFQVPLDERFPVSDYGLYSRYRFAGSNLRRPHIHQCMEIGYCHKGKGIFRVAGKDLH